MPIRAGHIVVTADFDVFGITAYKSGDESVTSSTVMQNDDLLVLPVVPNARYLLDCFFVYTGAADAAGGFKIGWTGPAGATMKWANFGVTQGVAPSLVNYNVVVEALAGGRGVATNGGTEMSCRPFGVLNTSTTGGNLQLQWAQGASNATPTVLKAGSTMQLRRIA